MNTKNDIKNSTALRLSGSTASKGFTLVELLVVIGIIAILFAVVLVAINPAKRFAEANNARRLSDVNSILNGVLNYTVDQKGALPVGLKVTTTGTVNYEAEAPRVIGSGAALTADVSCVGINTCTGAGYRSCTTDADCDNSCSSMVANVSGTCEITGVVCTQGGTPDVDGALGECGSGTSTAGDCTGNSCITGTPFAGRYCNQDADCTIGADTATCSTTNVINAWAKYDLGNSVEGVIPSYLASVPADPANSGTAPKYYAIENVKGAGRIHVVACNPDTIEGVTNTIEVIR